MFNTRQMDHCKMLLQNSLSWNIVVALPPRYCHSIKFRLTWTFWRNKKLIRKGWQPSPVHQLSISVHKLSTNVEPGFKDNGADCRESVVHWGSGDVNVVLNSAFCLLSLSRSHLGLSWFSLLLTRKYFRTLFPEEDRPRTKHNCNAYDFIWCPILRYVQDHHICICMMLLLVNG